MAEMDAPWVATANEDKFRSWYAGHAKTQNLDPNPDAREHFYDYRAAFKAGAGPDKEGHWPSKFKQEGHPRTIVDGVNTKTGEPSAPDAPWVGERRKEPRPGYGISDAFVSGYQGSAAGLMIRKKLPDVELDMKEARWYERAIAGATQLAAEFPLMVQGAIPGAAAGAAVGSLAGPVGTVAGGLMGGGAGAFAAPAAIRTALTQSYLSRETDSSADWLTRTNIMLKTTGKELLVGGATMGMGGAVGRVAGKVVAPMVGNQITARVAGGAIETAATAAEVATMTVTPAALEGRLPEWRDFIDGAILVGGLKASTHVAGRMAQVYAKTGIEPAQQVADARVDPTIKADLTGVPTLAEFSATLQTNHPKVNVTLGEHPNGAIDLKMFELRNLEADSGQGLGKKAMQELIDHADRGEKGVGLLASPAANSKMTLENLVDYYRKFDFVPLAEQEYSNAVSMWRDPRPKAAGADGPGRAQPSGVAGVPEIPRAYRDAAAADAAQNAVLEPGTPVPPRRSPFVDAKGTEPSDSFGTSGIDLRTHLKAIEDPASANAAIARAAELYGEKVLNQTRGKVSWAATEEAAARRLAEMIGERDHTLLMPREPGTGTGTTDMVVRAQIMQHAVERFTNMARDFDATKHGPGVAAEMMAAAEQVAMLSANFRGAASEAARATNQLKNLKAMSQQGEAVAELLRQYAASPEEIAAIMKQANNPVAAAKAARAIVESRTWDKLMEGLRASMISGPITVMANLAGNTVGIPLRPVIDVAAVPIGVLLGSAERSRLAEAPARVIGYWGGTLEAFQQAGAFLAVYGNKPAMEGLRALDGNTGGRKTESFKHHIGGDTGVILRLPFQALSIPDMLFRLIHEGGERNAIAARQAAAEGHGLMSREFRERMEYLKQNPTEAHLKEIAALGDRMTYTARLGKVGRTAQQLIKFSHTEFLFPFTTTPANLAKEMLRLSPAAPLIDTWRADIKAGGAKADKAVAELFVGGVIASVVVGMVQAGRITGQGDTDPNKQRVKLGANEQPYSFVNEDGEHFEYSRLQPVGTYIGLAADFSLVYDKLEEGEKTESLKMLGVAFASAITNQTMMLGMTNLVRAFSEPARFFEKFIQGLAAMPVPGAVSQTAQLMDPHLREIDSVWDAIRNRIPKWREGLEAKIDYLGEPIENRERLFGIGPVRMMTASDDLVRTEAARLGVGAPQTPKKIELSTGGIKDRKLGEVELTPEQRTLYATTAGKKAFQLLEPLVNSPEWEGKSDVVKKLTYDKVLEAARKVGKNAALTPTQREHEYARIIDGIRLRLAE